MAWAVSHRGEFYDDRGLIWRVDIELDSYAGSINEMTLTGDPLKIEWLAPGDDLLFSPIKGSVATINVWSNTHFQYTSLYSAENLKRRVSIYYIPVAGSTLTVDSTEVTVDSTAYTADDVYASAEGVAVLYWRGYLTADYSEPYDDVPYRVSLTAADGLGLLKDMLYKYTASTKNDTYYSGRRYESQVVLDILGKIGFTEFKEFCNLYDTNMSDGVGDSPFDQCLIDMDVFRDLTCYEVLEEILKKYNAIIRQINGQFYIFRPTEFDADTCYGRYFTAYNTKTAITCAPEQLIHRTTNASDIKDFNGGVLMMQPPLSQFTVYQDYGTRESWVKNHNFSIDTWDDATDTFDDWTHTGCQPLSYERGLEGEKDGVEIMPDGTGVNYNARQQFATYAKTCSDVFVLSFDYRLIKTTSGSASNVQFNVIVCDATFAYYLNDADDDVNTTATWGTTYHTIDRVEATVPKGLGNWTTVTYTISSGLPIDGPYYIYLFATNNSAVRVGYRNVRFFSTADTLMSKTVKVSKWPEWANMIPPFGFIRFFGGGYYKGVKSSYIQDQVEVVSRTYSSPDPATIEAPAREQQYMLGDCEDTSITNVIEQFKGSLAVMQTGSLVQTAIDFATNFADDYAALTTPGVILTAVAGALYFQSNAAGTDFTGSTTIVNATGNLAGTVTTTQANVAEVNAQHTIQLAGTSGTATISVGGVDATATYSVSLTTTATNFVTNHASSYAVAGITVTSDGDILTFEADGGVFNPAYTTTITTDTGDLTGDVDENARAYTAPVARIDRIVLSGTSGTATVTCHGEANTVTFNTSSVMIPTTAWSTRGGSENKPLIEMIADEVAAQYNRERHFIQMNLRERGNAAPDVNMLYNIQDDLNTYGGSRRVFVANRGTFDVLRGEWVLDAHEIL